MRRYVLGDTAGIGSWRQEEAADAPLMRDEVRVAMKAWSLNYRDLMVAKGTYGGKYTPGLVPLSDGAGEVLEVGPEVTDFKPGDRVVNGFFRDWQEGPLTAEKAKSAYGGGIPGVLAQRMVFPERALLKIPEGLSWEEAATLPCAGLTAWNALFDTGQLRPGQTVLLQGTGGVSMFALQFAKLAGARVLLTSSSDAKLAVADELGADAGINYTQHPEWERFAFEQTDGEGVDLVVEVGGSDTLGRSLRAVRPGGRVVVIGVLSGGIASLPIGLLLAKNVQLTGIYVGSRSQFRDMNRAIQQTGLSPIVDRTFDFHDASSALARLESGEHLGKIVIRG